MRLNKEKMLIINELYDKFNAETIQHKNWLKVLGQTKKYQETLTDLRSILIYGTLTQKTTKSLKFAIDTWIEEFNKYKIFLKIGGKKELMQENIEFINRLKKVF